MSLYDHDNPNHVAMLEHRRAGWTAEKEAVLQTRIAEQRKAK